LVLLAHVASLLEAPRFRPRTRERKPLSVGKHAETHDPGRCGT
jgi:hypothetical protein